MSSSLPTSENLKAHACTVSRQENHDEKDIHKEEFQGEDVHNVVPTASAQHSSPTKETQTDTLHHCSTQTEVSGHDIAIQTDQRPLASSSPPYSSTPHRLLPTCSTHTCEQQPQIQHHSLVRPQPTFQSQQWQPPLQLPPLMGTPAPFLSTKPCRHGTKSCYSVPRDSTGRAAPYNHWNAYCHHHSDNNDDDDKLCHNNHHDGDDRILSEQEWPFFKPHDTQKNGLGVAWVSRERKGHIAEKSESTDSDKARPSV